MASKPTDHIPKKWMIKQLRHATSLKTLARVQRFQEILLKRLEDEEDTKPQSLIAGDLTFDKVVEIFGLNIVNNRWEQHRETYDVPKSLTFNLAQLKKALYNKNSEAYNRIAIDYLIVACMVKHRNLLSKRLTLPADDPAIATIPILKQSELPIGNPHTQITTIVPILDQATKIAGPSYIAPTTPLVAPQDTSQPLPIKVVPQMSLSVRVERAGQEWLVSGRADWTMGYGDPASLEDGTVLLAIEAKRRETFSNAEAQLLAYLAIIRQLRIQANKENVMTQGFYSDGEQYRFICIRNNGDVMESLSFDISPDGSNLKPVFNFLLGMLMIAAESSTNTSPTKPGPEQDKKIENFDRELFVEVFEDVNVDDISAPPIYQMTEEDEWSDIIAEDE